MTYALQQPAATPADPKQAVVLRLGAWIIDLILYSFVSVGSFALLAKRLEAGLAFDRSSSYGYGTTVCAQLRQGRPLSECFNVNGTVWYTTGGRTITHLGLAVAWFIAIHVVIQGVTGGSLGKLIAGVRVVQANGGPPGVGRALVRSLMWIVDGIPFCIPLVGLITLLATGRKQRVGDLVAGTFVIRAAELGNPVNSGKPPPRYPPPP